MAAHRGKTDNTPNIFLMVAAVGLTVVFAIANIARDAASFGPRVGAIVSFDPAHPGLGGDGTTIVAAQINGMGCEVDLDLVRQSGGSFIVEQRDPAPAQLWHVHWAGPRTSAGAADCGPGADLAMPTTQVMALAAAAGGFGVAHGVPSALK